MPMSACSISSATNRSLSGYPNYQLGVAPSLIVYSAALHIFHMIG